MAWVATDKHGEEYIYEYLPERFYDRWAPQSCDGFYASDYILLPKGSIKKLIGRELSWSDEPVELKEE
jgi:hypothetical protein